TQLALRASSDAGIRHDADLAQAYALTQHRWADALERRGTPTALLTAAFFDRPDESPEDETRRTFRLIARAIDASPDDAVLLSAAASFCRAIVGVAECRRNFTRARLRALEPDNAFAWSVTAPYIMEVGRNPRRLADEADYW